MGCERLSNLRGGRGPRPRDGPTTGCWRTPGSRLCARFVPPRLTAGQPLGGVLLEPFPKTLEGCVDGRSRVRVIRCPNTESTVRAREAACHEPSFPLAPPGPENHTFPVSSPLTAQLGPRGVVSAPRRRAHQHRERPSAPMGGRDWSGGAGRKEVGNPPGPSRS